MNTKEKGKRIERKGAERLKELGYRVERPIETKFNRTDFFGLFDAIAVKKDRIKFIQWKANRASGIRETGKKAKEFIDIERFDVEYWIWHDRQGWRIKRLEKEGWKTILDQR